MHLSKKRIEANNLIDENIMKLIKFLDDEQIIIHGFKTNDENEDE